METLLPILSGKKRSHPVYPVSFDGVNMQIVIDATAAVSGGRVYLSHLLPELFEQAATHQFIIFHHGDLDELPDIQGHPRFDFRKVRMPGIAAENWLFASAIKFLWRLFILPWHLHHLCPELFFSNAGSAPAFAPTRTRMIVALHNSMPLRDELVRQEKSAWRRVRLHLLRKMLRRTVRRCQGVIVFSEDSAQSLRTFAGRECPELFVVRHGIDWNVAQRERPMSQTLLKEMRIVQPFLLYVAHLHRYKNILRLIQAFDLLAPRHPQLHLLIIGGTGDADYQREVIAQIQASPFSERIRLRSECSRRELLAMYRAAACFVHPSLAETCSFPLLEALAMGLPVAASRMSALPEMAGDAAIYFDPESSADIADKLHTVLSDEKLRQALRGRAINRAAAFSWKQTAAQTLKVFEKVSRRHLPDETLTQSRATTN